MMNTKSSENLAVRADAGCVAVAVAILGDKWTPHIIRALSTQNLRFCRLQDEVGGVNPRTLSARLTHLEEMQIITKAASQNAPLYGEYVLTEKGKDLIPILDQMAAWGAKHGPNHHA